MLRRTRGQGEQIPAQERNATAPHGETRGPEFPPETLFTSPPLTEQD